MKTLIGRVKHGDLGGKQLQRKERRSVSLGGNCAGILFVVVRWHAGSPLCCPVTKYDYFLSLYCSYSVTILSLHGANTWVVIYCNQKRGVFPRVALPIVDWATCLPYIGNTELLWRKSSYLHCSSLGWVKFWSGYQKISIFFNIKNLSCIPSVIL